MKEETNLESRKIQQIFEDKYIYDDKKGHFARAYLALVDKDSKPVYNEEIDPKNSRFESPEMISERLKKEEFTPLSKQIVTYFLKKYPTQQDLQHFYHSIIEA